MLEPHPDFTRSELGAAIHKQRNPVSRRSTPPASVAFELHKERYSAAAVTTSAGVMVGAAAVFAHLQLLAVAVLVGSALLSWRQYSQGRVRERGFEVEKKAVQQLRNECEARGWRLWTDLHFKGVGNLDAVVETASIRVVCEIKSYQGLLAAGNLAVRANKARTPAHHDVQQVLRQVESIGGGVPLLWCPKSNLGLIQQAGRVVLVSGPASTLCRAIVTLERNVS